MKAKILGCSGGIGGPSLRTTSILIDDDILIDAGTGIADLDIDEMGAVDHVFITHTHLDHIAALPLMLDTVADRRRQPLTIHATREVLDILRQHIFNWLIWPDFSEIPSAAAPTMRFAEIAVGQAVDLGGERLLTPLPVEHSVPAVGYHLASGNGSLVFSGDTGSCPAFWQAVNGIADLRYLIVECAFPDEQAELAALSKHYCPQALLADLRKLERQCEIFVMHLKPGMEEKIMQEIADETAWYQPRILTRNTLLEF